MSIHDTERGLIALYMMRVLERSDMPMRSLRYILYWLNDRADLLNFTLPKPLTKSIGNIYSGSASLSDFSKAFHEHKEKVISDFHQAAKSSGRPEPMEANLEALVHEMGLPKLAAKIGSLITCYTRFELIQYFCDTVVETAGPVSRAMAILIGEPTRRVDQLLTPNGELILSGLVQYREGGQEIAGPGGRFSIPLRLDNCLDQHFDDFSNLRQALLGDAMQANICFDDYDHVARDRDLLTSVLKGAVSERAKGVNILLYGPPGSGKTELTKVAAKEAGLSLYGAGEDVSAEGETDRSARLSDMVFAQRLLCGAEKTAILFDEMEDVAWQLIKRGGSKLYLNRMLENNALPVLWTSNNISEIDPAVLRRMTLAIELKKPPVRQRERILQKLSQRVGVQLLDQEVVSLAQKLDTTPAILENALKAAKYAGGGGREVEQAASGILRAISGIATRHDTSVPKFDPSLSLASRDLPNLTERLLASKSLAFSMCLSGPPGTGKSAFARHLAGRLGIEVLQKRASDLLGPYVGQSEQHIAQAFEEAREANAFLIFDEADSLLYDRTQAHRSWEITQVNEMLTWMESHPYPVCFTTNLMDRIDTASLRRFTFHVRFECLDKIALKRAYQVFLMMDAVPDDGLIFDNLTPGDFAQARKQAEVLGIMRDRKGVIELLADISKTKPGASGHFGFMQ
ncbi:MAG: ATP-binding protein [Pseudomonadota bacterium]